MKKFKIMFRVDASNLIGTGHIRRCITIAKAIRKKGIQVLFVINKNSTNHENLLVEEKFDFFEINESENWKYDSEQTLMLIKDFNIETLVVDNYLLDSKWEKNIYENTNLKLVVIDDLANRKHYCDLLIDQSFERKQDDYISLMEKDTQISCGSRYAILREEFSKERASSLKTRKKNNLTKILINFGGTDPDNVTMQVVKKLKEIPHKKYEFSVLVGENYTHLKELNETVEDLSNFKIIENPNSVSKLLCNMDIVIGAGGTSTWERCCLGIPSIMLKIAENQNFILKKFKKAKLALVPSVNNSLQKNISLIHEELLKLDEQKFYKMGLDSSKLIDGKGTQRVLRKIIN